MNTEPTNIRSYVSDSLIVPGETSHFPFPLKMNASKCPEIVRVKNSDMNRQYRKL